MTWQQHYSGSLINAFGMPSRELVRGEGVHLYDDQGARYLDLLAGIATASLGHAHPAYVAALADQAATLSHVSNFFTSLNQIALAERLSALLGHDAKVFLANSGTEANEAAFKVTRRTGRTRIIAAENSFHGRTMGALAITHKAAYREPFEPLPGDVTFVPFGDVEALTAAVDDTVLPWCWSRCRARRASSCRLTATSPPRGRSHPVTEPCCGSTRSRPASAGRVPGSTISARGSSPTW